MKNTRRQKRAGWEQGRRILIKSAEEAELVDRKLLEEASSLSAAPPNDVMEWKSRAVTFPSSPVCFFPVMASWLSRPFTFFQHQLIKRTPVSSLPFPSMEEKTAEHLFWWHLRRPRHYKSIETKVRRDIRRSRSRQDQDFYQLQTEINDQHLFEFQVCFWIQHQFSSVL